MHQFTFSGRGGLSLLDEREIAFLFDPQTDTSTAQRTVYRPSASGVWEQGSTTVVDFSTSEWHGRGANYIALDEGALGNRLLPAGRRAAVIQPSHIAGLADAARVLFYERNGDWNLAQEIQVSDPVGSRLRRFASAGDNLVVAHSNPQATGGSDSFPLSVSLLNRGDEGQWRIQF